MTRSRRITAIVLGVLAAAAFVFAIMRARPTPQRTAVATANRTTAVAAGDVALDTVVVRDPEALAALDRMGTYLQSLKAFQLKAEVVTEEVRTDGQKVQITRNVDLVARRPNRLYAEVKNDRQRRLFFYDGANFTLYAPRSSFYSTVAAPGTLAKLADQLEEKFDIQLPLVDLFRWGTAEANANTITSAIDLGPSAINGVTCEQYAYRQEGVDWQLWVQRGEAALPCRIVITTLTDDARPQHMATYSWNLAPSYDDNTFVFRTPPDAKRIPFVEVPLVATSLPAERK